MLKVVKLPQTIFLKIWRSDIDSRSPLLFLKVNATCILAIGFLNDQNCWKKMTNESTYGEIHNSTSTQTCVLCCTQIFHNLIGWTCIVCILFAFNDYSTISNILRFWRILFFSTFITFSIAENQSIKQIKITDEAMTSTITFLNSWVLPEFLQYLGN